MPAYTQANAPIAITTPLGKDVLLLTDFEGHEAISELFRFRVDLVAPNQTEVRFENIVGESVTVELSLPGGGKRYFNGIVNRFAQGHRDVTFTHFRAEVVPRLWLLTKNVQSRIFQHLTVPEILREVLEGLNVQYELRVQYELLESYHPRDYCAQYRESDFAFVSRLMEEEGIYYFFKHADGSHQMVVSDTPVHPDLPGQSNVMYEGVLGGSRDNTMRVIAWEKTQELRSGKYTLWDHCFELPGENLEARQSTLDSVVAGAVTHKLKVGGNDQLEIYEYPGGYAQRFDGIDRSGGTQPQELTKIFTDNERTVRIRMEQEDVLGLEIHGVSYCRHFIPGHEFTLTRHFDGDGSYLLTSVEHSARCGDDFRSGERGAFEYKNRFTCIPASLPYRPLRVTPRPTIAGTQTATVVGPPDQEIFCDKYGRVKVQFHWDRLGKRDAESSCWIRVAQPWAGGGFGTVAIPRIGHEVVVDFLEGDPDQPLIVGCVYNAGKMPPFSLPENRMFSGIKAKSLKGNPSAHFSGLEFNDTPGSERVALYAEKDMMVNSEHDLKHHVGHNQHVQIGNISLTTVGGIPGGSGSGGGGGGPEGGMQSAATTESHVKRNASVGNWETSNGLLSAQPGMAGTVVYGVNSQDTVGFMHSITIGAAYQVCVDPLGYFGFIPNPLSIAGGISMGLLGAVGGNVQLCYGMNTEAVYGPAITINHGPKIEITAEPSGWTIALACLVPALSVAYELGFAAMYDNPEDDQASGRAELYAASVAVIPLATAALLALEMRDRVTLMAKRAATATKEDTLLSTFLGIAGSALLPDFMKKMIPDATVSKQATKPELPLTVFDDANSINFVEGVLLQLAKHVHVIAAKDLTKKADRDDPNPSTVYINASGKGDDGVVFVNGTKGVTLTAQPAEMIEMSKEGIRIEVGALGKIRVACGPQMRLDQGVPLQMGGPGIYLDPAEGITMMCGPSMITIHPINGVTIRAPKIELQ